MPVIFVSLENLSLLLISNIFILIILPQVDKIDNVKNVNLPYKAKKLIIYTLK